MSGGAGLGFVNGALAGRVFPLGPRVVVGRDPRNEVAFPPDADAVSTRHAQLLADPHDATSHLLFDLQSRAGTFVDGERLPPNEPVRLMPGAVVRFGTAGPLAVYDVLSALETTASALTLVREDQRAAAWRLDRPLTIGRDATCDVALDPERDTLASSRHVRLTPAFGRIVVSDLGSANGTWIDGKRVVESLLPAGVVVRLGQRGPALRVSREAPTPAPSSRPTGANPRVAQPPTASPQKAAYPPTPTPAVGSPRPATTPPRAAHPSGATPAVRAASTSPPVAAPARVTPPGGTASTTPPGGTPSPAKSTPASGGIPRPESAGLSLPSSLKAAPGSRAAPPLAQVKRPESTPPAPAPAPGPAPAPLHTTPPGGTPAVAEIQLESFKLEVSSAGSRGRVHVFVKPELHLGSYGALNDIVLSCFPRELESEKDAVERSESIGPEHIAFELTKKGVALRDLGGGVTKLNGQRLAEGERVDLHPLADVALGEDTLGLRARLFAHPRLPATEPRLGQEHKHPVECLVLERKGDGADHLYVMLVRQASIGSSDDAAIHLDVPGVAPQHALLFLKQGRLWLSQLGEAPVAVAGAPLRPGTAAPIDPGVKFFIGAAAFEMLECAPEDFDPAW